MLQVSHVLDLFFPKFNSDFSSPHHYLTLAEIKSQQGHFKSLEPEHSEVLEQIYICSKYEENLIQDLVERAKFHLEFSICETFAELIQIQAGQVLGKPELLIPVPSDPKRLLIRGGHIPEIIAKYLSQKMQVPMSNCLVKQTTTEQQSLLNRQERLKNLDGVFVVKDYLDVNLSKHTKVWLVDDLTTTGSTFVECARVLKIKLPFLKIYGIAVASN